MLAASSGLLAAGGDVLFFAGQGDSWLHLPWDARLDVEGVEGKLHFLRGVEACCRGPRGNPRYEGPGVDGVCAVWCPVSGQVTG